MVAATSNGYHQKSIMRYREIKPTAPFDRFLQCFWILEDEVKNEWDAVEQVVPDGSMELIIHYGTPFLQAIEGARSHELARAVVAGQCTSTIHLKRRGAVGMIAARFHPAAATCIFPGHMFELTDRVLTLETIGKMPADELVEKIQLADSDEERVGLLERWLLGLIQNRNSNVDDLIHATSLIQTTHGQIDIATVAKRLAMSTRTLERKFLQKIGLTPKQFARIVRFRHVLHVRACLHNWSWTQVAMHCGYTDQAHLIHDFRRFSNLSPARFLRECSEMATHLAFATAND